MPTLAIKIIKNRKNLLETETSEERFIGLYH